MSNIFKICLSARNVNSSLVFLTEDGPYLAQLLPMVCRLQCGFQIMDMTLEHMVKVKYP